MPCYGQNRPCDEIWKGFYFLFVILIIINLDHCRIVLLLSKSFPNKGAIPKSKGDPNHYQQGRIVRAVKATFLASNCSWEGLLLGKIAKELII